MLARVAATLRERQAIRLAINPEGEEGGALVLHENCNVSDPDSFKLLQFVFRRGPIELTGSPDDVNNQPSVCRYDLALLRLPRIHAAEYFEFLLWCNELPYLVILFDSLWSI